MANNLYTTKTAALKATKADINKLDAKKIFLGGENILDIIKNATPTIKHSKDTRETVTENDLWGQWVETTSDGTIIVHDDEIINPNGDYPWNTSITKVVDDKAYVGDTLYGNIQTEKIKDGRSFFYMDSALTSFAGNLDNLVIGGGSGTGDGMFYYCTNLKRFNSDLSSLTNGINMFWDCYELSYFISDYSGSPVNLSSLTDGDYMFYNCTALTTFTSDLSSLTSAKSMFYNCNALTTFTSDLSSLTYGNSMFGGCDFTRFNYNLPSLTNGSSMFYNCSNLTTFTSDLSSLTSGYDMFENCSKLSTFTSDLSSLTNGRIMFADCSALTTFNNDLSSLTDGSYMFTDCSSLTTFTSDLSSLTSGYMMFYKTKLIPQSVMYIVDSIKDIDAEKKLYGTGTGKIPYVTLANGEYSSTKGFMSYGNYVYTYNVPEPYTTIIYASEVGKLHIGINVTDDANTIQDQLQAFAEEATFDSWEDLKQAFVDKGWTVTWQYGGTYDSITYDLRGDRAIPCPIYAQLVEISPEGIELDEEGNQVGEKFYTDEQKGRAEYTNEEGTKFYNISWGHDVTNYDDFQQFDSLEDAMVAYGVIIKQEEEEQD